MAYNWRPQDIVHDIPDPTPLYGSVILFFENFENSVGSHAQLLADREELYKSIELAKSETRGVKV
jgi:hypothetical protein